MRLNGSDENCTAPTRAVRPRFTRKLLFFCGLLGGMVGWMGSRRTTPRSVSRVCFALALLADTDTSTHPTDHPKSRQPTRRSIDRSTSIGAVRLFPPCPTPAAHSPIIPPVIHHPSSITLAAACLHSRSRPPTATQSSFGRTFTHSHTRASAIFAMEGCACRSIEQQQDDDAKAFRWERWASVWWRVCGWGRKERSGVSRGARATSRPSIHRLSQ